MTGFEKWVMAWLQMGEGFVGVVTFGLVHPFWTYRYCIRLAYRVSARLQTEAREG